MKNKNDKRGKSPANFYDEIDIGPNKIYNEDCLWGMERIAKHSVDLILCDLPYGTTKCRWDILIPFPDLWRQYERILKPSGNILLFGTGLFAYKLALSNESWFRYELIWKKSKCGSPFTAKYMPMKRHENILVFGRPAATYNPQMQPGIPYARRWTPNKRNELGHDTQSLFWIFLRNGEDRTSCIRHKNL